MAGKANRRSVIQPMSLKDAERLVEVLKGLKLDVRINAKGQIEFPGTELPPRDFVMAAIVERRDRGGEEWEVFRTYIRNLPTEADLILGCRDLAERMTGMEFRYRFATLYFEDDGRHATIY